MRIQNIYEKIIQISPEKVTSLEPALQFFYYILKKIGDLDEVEAIVIVENEIKRAKHLFHLSSTFMEDADDLNEKFEMPYEVALLSKPDNVFFYLTFLVSPTPEDAFYKLAQYYPPEERDLFLYRLKDQYPKLNNMFGL